MIPPCPRCLSTEHVEQRRGHLPICLDCWVVYTGDPSEQAKYAQWRKGASQMTPYEELSPQDQVARIAFEEGVDNDTALDIWAARLGPDEPKPAVRPPADPWPTRNRREWA